MRLLYSTRRGFDSSAMTLSELGVGYPIGLVSLTRILIALPSRRSASPASKSMKLASFATQDATQYYRRCRTRDLAVIGSARSRSRCSATGNDDVQERGRPRQRRRVRVLDVGSDSRKGARGPLGHSSISP